MKCICANVTTGITEIKENEIINKNDVIYLSDYNEACKVLNTIGDNDNHILEVDDYIFNIIMEEYQNS